MFNIITAMLILLKNFRPNRKNLTSQMDLKHTLYIYTTMVLLKSARSLSIFPTDRPQVSLKVGVNYECEVLYFTSPFNFEDDSFP